MWPRTGKFTLNLHGRESLPVAGDMLSMEALSLAPSPFFVAAHLRISTWSILHFGHSSISRSRPHEYGDSTPTLSHP
jgi:hypothetical protein